MTINFTKYCFSGKAFWFEMCTELSQVQNWKEAITATICKVNTDNLTPNARYWFSIGTIKGTVLSEFSDPVTIFIEPKV